MRMIIAATTGNVGIGTASPSHKLHVDGDGYFTGQVYSHGYSVLENGNIDTLTFANGANNRVCTINNNGAIKLDVANVGASDGWETGYYAKSGSTYIGCFGLFGVGTALDYAFIGTGYNNTWLAVKSNGNVGIGTTKPLAKLHVDGSGYISSSIGIAGIDQYHALYVNGNSRFGGLVGIGTSAQSGYSLYVNGNTAIGGTLSVGNASIFYQASASGVIEGFTINTNSHVINIATGGKSAWLSGTWGNSSDIRLKTIIANIGASVEQIANAPVFCYKFRNVLDSDIFMGTSAQYWEKVFPVAVKQMSNGYLSLDYESTALAAAVITARKVKNHEDRIRDLENDNRELREEIRLLKAA